MSIEYKTDDGSISAGVEFIKEKDRWVIKDIDVDLSEKDE